jgi:hypothetical protein
MANRTLGSQPYMPVLPSNNQEAMSSGDIYYEIGPNSSNQERLVTAALMTATIPGAIIQAQVRPPLPQIDPFRPRFGYPDYPDRQADITQVLNVDRYYRNRRDDVSGGVQGWQSAARNVGVHDVW